MYNFSQEQIFVIFFIIGIIIGMLFDFFRELRKSIKTSDNVTLVEDVIFLVLSGYLFTYSILKINNGEIRFYIFLAIFCGFFTYSLTIGRLCAIIFYVIIEICKKILLIPYFCWKKVQKHDKINK